MSVIVKPNKPIGGAGGPDWLPNRDLYADELNLDVDTIVADYNGNIDDSNCSDTMALKGYKIADRPNGVPANKLNDGSINLVAMIVDALITGGKLKLTKYAAFPLISLPAAGNSVAADTGVPATKIPFMIYAVCQDANVSNVGYLHAALNKNLNTNTWWIKVKCITGYTLVSGDAIEAYFIDP